MNFLIFIFSYIDIQPEYNLLSFILSAHSKLNIGPVKHQQHFYPCEKIQEPVSCWIDDWFWAKLSRYISSGLASTIVGPSMFVLHERSVLFPQLQVGSDLLVRVWRSWGFYWLLLHIDLQWWGHGKVGSTSYHFIFNVKYSWFRQHYFYLIIPCTESHCQWFSVQQYFSVFPPNLLSDQS